PKSAPCSLSSLTQCPGNRVRYTAWIQDRHRYGRSPLVSTAVPPPSRWRRVRAGAARCRGGPGYSDDHAELSAHPDVAGTPHDRLMRPRSPARPRCACDPVLPRGPRAQETVWAQARRNNTWGDRDPEWTAGDDAGLSTTALPVPIAEPRTTG